MRSSRLFVQPAGWMCISTATRNVWHDLSKPNDDGPGSRDGERTQLQRGFGKN